MKRLLRRMLIRMLTRILPPLLRRRAAHIPDPMWRGCVARLPYLRRLPPADLQRLKNLSEILLDTHTLTGAGGFEVTDEIAVSIAAQACLPALNLTLDQYEDMAGIIVYPSEFIVPFAEVDEAGVMHEWREPISGEAIEAGGAVILSWEDVEPAALHDSGYNVVIHEFAHKIDMRDGMANGCPPFLPEFHAGLQPRQWQQAFSAAYADFTQRAAALETQLEARFASGFDPDAAEHAALSAAPPAGLPLDSYAAHHPAEFFAVASEAFFVRPLPLAKAYPELYRLLAAYYRQQPLDKRQAACQEKKEKC